jgi:hypothetical protein
MMKLKDLPDRIVIKGQQTENQGKFGAPGSAGKGGSTGH